MKALLPEEHPARAFSTSYMLKDLCYALELASTEGLVSDHLLQQISRISNVEALKQIEENDATGPTFVTLHLKETAPALAFDELVRQAGAKLETQPPALMPSARTTRRRFLPDSTSLPAA